MALGGKEVWRRIALTLHPTAPIWAYPDSRAGLAGAAAAWGGLQCGNVRRMPTAAVNGIQVNYADSGGEGPAAVLSHGLLLDQSMFDAQVAALAPEYRVTGRCLAAT
jgi:hypothetical protein